MPNFIPDYCQAMSEEQANHKSTTGGVSRVEEKLRVALESENFYEAHQLYRTLYFRFSTQKKFEELKRILFDGASQFLRRGQFTSGADLASLYVDVLSKSCSPVDERTLDNLEQIYSLIPPRNETVNRETFAQASFQWSISVQPAFPKGHPKLHRKYALVLWHEKSYQQARQHFLLSDDGEACASFLIEYHLYYGYPNEVDLFVAQAVFQFLCYKNTVTASTVFDEYTQKHPKLKEDGGPPFVLPLLNFVWLLLLCIETGHVSFYTILVEKYQTCLRRDTSYIQYLDKIGQVFFGLPPPHSGKSKNSFFDSLLKDLLTDDAEPNESDSSLDAQAAAGSSSTRSKNLLSKEVESTMQDDDVLD